MQESLKGLITDKHFLLIEPFTLEDIDHPALTRVWKELEPTYIDLIKARKLVSEELWNNYKIMDIHNLPEQKIYASARKAFLDKLKVLGAEHAKKSKTIAK